MAQGKGITDKVLIKIMKAREINRYMCGGVIAPWELDDLPETWQDAFDALIYDLPGMRKGFAEVEKVKEGLKHG
jgi:hypothetical protein